MVTPTVTTKVNNSNYDVSADQWNALMASTKNQPYSYIIYKSGSTYYARNGATGAVDYSEAALADALTEAFTALTADGGVIFLSQLAFPMTSFASIPEGVRVVCDYGAEHWEYINSADSSGSTYTVSVGSGVNAGYYLAQDSEGRICNTSTSWGTLLNAVIACCSSGDTVQVQDGLYSASASFSIYMKSGVNVVGESREGVQFTSTGNIIFRFNGVSNATLANCYISHAGGTNIMSVYIYGTTPDNNVIDNVYFAGTATWAINIASASYLTVKNCVVDGENIKHFIYATQLAYSKILYNKVENCTAGGFAVWLKHTSFCEINFNTFINAVNYKYTGMIVLSNVGGDSIGNDICFNKFFFTANPMGVGVSAIVISGESSETYLNKQVLVEGNYMKVEDDVTNINAFVYTHGLSSNFHTVVDVTLINNRLYGGTTNPTKGCIITYTDYYLITNQQFDNMQQYAIHTADSDFGIIKNNVFKNFNLLDGGYIAIYQQGSHINVTTSDNLGDDL